MNQGTKELPILLETHDISASEVVTLAELLADLHLHARIAGQSQTHAQTEQIRKSVLGNLAQLIAHLPAPEPSIELGPLIDWTHDRIRSLEASLQQREDAGCIRECHGDLRAAHFARWQHHRILFAGAELDSNSRWIDVIDDLASLIMDLVSHERQDLAFALLSRYLEITGDYDGVTLLRFYAVYRALQRAKADALNAEQWPERAGEFRARLQRRIRAATAWITPTRPVLILTHGPSGSGKSWLCERLVPQLAAIRVRSDLERKRLAGIKPSLSGKTGLGQGIDATKFTQTTYQRLADCAATCLRAGFNTIVEATFLDPADRERFRRLAAQLGAECVIVSCHSDPASWARRVQPRFRAKAYVADLAIIEAQLRTIQPLSASEARQAITVDITDKNALQQIVTAVAAASTCTPSERTAERCSV